MENKLKYVAVVLILTLLTGCTAELPFYDVKSTQPTNIKIGVSIYDEYDTFISDLVGEMKVWSKKEEQVSGITITLDVVSARGSQLTQNDQIERFADKEYDVLCVNLVDRTDASVIIDKAKSADIPIVFFNRELVEEDLERWNKLYYVGAVAKESGELQGQIVIDALQEKFAEIDFNGDGIIQYIMLEGEAGHQDALVRTQSSISKIKEAGFSVEKLGDEIANWNRAQANTKMTDLYKKYTSQIEVIIANDDDMALGALDALESIGAKRLPLIVGVNGTSDALDVIKTKKMEGTVYNDAAGQAKAIMELAFSLGTNQDIPNDIIIRNEKYVYLPYKIIDYDNVQQYIVERTK